MLLSLAPHNKVNNKANSQQPARKGWLDKYWLLAAVVLVAALGALVLNWNSDDNTMPGSGNTVSTAGMTNTAASLSSDAANPQNTQAGTPLTAEQRAAQLIELQKRLALAEQTYAEYKINTKYPQGSRPISEHPDQVYPNRPVEESRALRKTDGTFDPTVNVKTTQTRVFVANKESVVFSLTAVDKSGKILPVFVSRAVAIGIASPDQRAGAQVTMQFSDDGANGDASGGDGAYSATLNPGATGLANFNGTIRTDVKFNVGDRSGLLFFDIIYTPETPATWTGGIRDAQEEGSLNFYLKANVNQAGRYIINGRVDDAAGKPFALLNFNNALQAGPQEIKLSLFGKLLSDQKPVFPLTLRDVDGYLLKDNTDPDRALMPRLQGTVHVTKKYTAASFSTAEDESEQRTRNLTELAKDVNQAKTALDEIKGK